MTSYGGADFSNMVLYGVEGMSAGGENHGLSRSGHPPATNVYGTTPRHGTDVRRTDFLAERFVRFRETNRINRDISLRCTVATVRQNDPVICKNTAWISADKYEEA